MIRDELEDYHKNDIASALPDLDAKERQVLYRLMTAVDVLKNSKSSKKTGMA